METETSKKKRVFKIAPGLAPPAPVQLNAIEELKVDEELKTTDAATEVTTTTNTSSAVKVDCEKLYDPCTKEEIASFPELEKRVREIKQSLLKKIDERKELPHEVKTRLDLLLFVLNQEKEPDLGLLEYKRGDQSGQIFEAYWDIVFALGLIPRYPINKQFYMYNGSIDGISNMNDIKLVQNPIQYLESRGVNMGASGASDITFVYKETKEKIGSDPCSNEENTLTKKPKFIFCSSKLFKNDGKKNVEKYDIQKIYTAAKNLNVDYDYEIVLLVQNRQIVLDKIKRAISQYIAEEASSVFGAEDLIIALKQFYGFIKNNTGDKKLTKEDLLSQLNIKEYIKPILNLRFHQDLAVHKITKAVQRFNESPTDKNKFLVGILPRGGKTYIAAGIVRDLKPKRVVVLLGAKTETLEQFKEEMFDYYQDFNTYSVINLKEESPVFDIDETKKYIFIMSVELYKKELTSRKLLMDLKENPKKRADLFICDEGHLKQVTEKAAAEMRKATEQRKTELKEEETALQEVDSLISKSVPVVYMTGTYMRPLSAFKIPYENIVIWDYEDLQMGKKMNEDDSYFRSLYSDLYDFIIQKQFSKGETFDTIASIYKKFPDLHLITTQFDEGAKKIFSDQGSGRGFSTIEQMFRLKKGFDIKTTKPEDWFKGHQNEKDVQRLINFLSPPDFQSENNNDTPKFGSVMKSIDRISQRLGDRLAFVSTKFVPHTQIWFMARSNTDLIFNRMPVLASTIFQNKWFRKNFNILAVSNAEWKNELGSNNFELTYADGNGTLILGCSKDYETLKQCIISEELKARKQNKGLIILAQKMLQVGISLACADVVVLLDTGENVDERVQKMFRALTESPFKKVGYIVDLNYFRTVKAIMDYNITSYKVKKQKKTAVSSQEAGELFNKILDLYYIDDDKPIYKEDIKATFPELQTLIQKDGVGDMKIENAGRILNTNIEHVLYDEYDDVYEYVLDKIKERKEKERKLREEGSNVKKAENENNESDEEKSIDLNSEKPQLFTDEIENSEEKFREAFMDIMKTVLKLGIFTTDEKTIEDLMERLTSDEDFKETVFETLDKRGDIKISVIDEIKEEQKDYLFNDLIIPNLQKILDKNKEESYSTMKEQYNKSGSSTEKRIDNVLKYINDHLAPKTKEREKFGEVFTPLNIVDEILSKLPGEVWSNPDLKWLDPANGMGNFPIKAFLGQKDGKYTYPGLFEGLRNKIKDDDKRCKHIVENMLYMIDINGKNNRVAANLFDKLCPNASPNIEKIDLKKGFLSAKPLKFANGTISEFDIIMANPPFNPPKTETGSSGNSIWQHFVMKSFTLLKEKGYLCFIHPPGWKKPTDEVYNPEKFKSGEYIGQIRQGQVWQVLKDKGTFKYIYTNDQKLKSIGDEYIDYFPAVDFYIYQKGGKKEDCDTKNIFIGNIFESKGVKLNYNLSYLPNLINKETQEILNKVASKSGEKPNFIRFRSPKGFSTDSSKGKYKYIYTFGKNGEPKYQYSNILNENLTMNKVVMNFDGGIDSYTVIFLNGNENIGSYEMTMYYKVDNVKQGKIIKDFFSSDLVKFIFLITQYASGKMTKNEPLVANSITIPPDNVTDYYKYFEIEKYKDYIEDILSKYKIFKQPKRKAKTEKVKKTKEGGSRRFTKTRKLNRG